MDIKETMLEAYELSKKNGYQKYYDTDKFLRHITNEVYIAKDRKRENQRILISVDHIFKTFMKDNNITTFEEAVLLPQFKKFFEKVIRDTFEDEIASIVINLFDLCEGLEIDLEWLIKLRLAYYKLHINK